MCYYSSLQQKLHQIEIEIEIFPLSMARGVEEHYNEMKLRQYFLEYW